MANPNLQIEGSIINSHSETTQGEVPTNPQNTHPHPSVPPSLEDFVISPDEGVRVPQIRPPPAPLLNHYNKALLKGLTNEGGDLSEEPDLPGHVFVHEIHKDREKINNERTRFPLRMAVEGDSDDELSDIAWKQYGSIPTPWVRNHGNFKNPTPFTAKDAILSDYDINFDGETLILDEGDYIPNSKAWGYSLLGFFAGRFPGKNMVERLVESWGVETKIGYHPNGWIVFRFEHQDQRDEVRIGGPYTTNGIHLIVFNMPKEFRFESIPNFKFPVWGTLIGLPVELWNERAISKISKAWGVPIELNLKSVEGESMVGPRVHLLVDGKKKPKPTINLQLHHGGTHIQEMRFDFYPVICTSCEKLGHDANNCRVKSQKMHQLNDHQTNPHRRSVWERLSRPWNPTRNGPHGRSKSREQSRGRSKGPKPVANHGQKTTDDEGWQVVTRGKNKSNMVWQQKQGPRPKTPTQSAVNNHIRFDSVTPCSIPTNVVVMQDEINKEYSEQMDGAVEEISEDDATVEENGDGGNMDEGIKNPQATPPVLGKEKGADDRSPADVVANTPPPSDVDVVEETPPFNKEKLRYITARKKGKSKIKNGKAGKQSMASCSGKKPGPK